jgi:ADP-heptose:LPS heptosyltransferase
VAGISPEPTSRRAPRRGERRYVFVSPAKRLAAALFDFAGTALVLLLTLGRGMKPDSAALADPRSILVVRLDHLGDVLFARPALRALRERFPSARIAVLASSAGAELLRHDENVDEVIAWDAPWFARGRGGAERGFLAVASDLRRRRFDISLELRGDTRHHFLLWLAGVKVRAGFGITGGGFLLHVPVRLRPGVHEVERDLDAAAAVGAISRPAGYAPLTLSPDEAEAGERFWRTAARPRVVVHPSAGDPAKRWPLPKLADIVDGLAGLGGEVLLVGSAGEREWIDAVRETSCTRPADVCGATTLGTLLGLIDSADLLVGSDSGPAHLALTQGKPVVMLWSTTNDPAEWGPWGAAARSVVVREPSRPEAAGEAVDAARGLL